MTHTAFCVHKLAVATPKLTSSYGFHEEWSHIWNLKNIWKSCEIFPSLKYTSSLEFYIRTSLISNHSGLQDWVRPRWITVTQALHAVSLQLVERSTEDRGCPLCSCLLESTPCVVYFLTFWNGPVWSALLLIPLFWLKQEDTVETILWRNFRMLFSPLQGRLPKVERFGLPPQHLPK